MLVSRQSSVASVRRDAWVEVDLGAIEENIFVIKSWLKAGTKLMAVVKSDAYGHGAVGVSEVLAASGADWMGVASVDEGCQLRTHGVNKPILILSPCPSWALSTAIESDLHLTVTASSQVEDIVDAALRSQKAARVHLKVDTGMHRLGVAPNAALDLAALLVSHKEIKLEGVFSHLASADNREKTSEQNECFKRALSDLAGKSLKTNLIHLASGDATRLFPETHYDMVRPGLILYGLESKTVSKVVRPAMSVKARINHLLEIEAGESVGYNLTWTAKRRSRIASIPIGYADGIDRGLSNRMRGLLANTEVPQVGLISMDQMLFDITDVPQAQESDVITILGKESSFSAASQTRAGKELFMADWANALDTVTYELACRLRARMPRIYTRHVAPSGAVGG